MQEWKFSEKEAQKMTHDGAISVNLVTGEATHISDRPPEQDYSPDHEAAGTVGRAMDEAAGHVERRQAKKARRKRRDTFREGEAARNRPSSRLQFSEADRAAPELKKPIRKSDKAVDKLDAAKAAVPVKPPGKEHGNPLSRPVQEIRSTLHGEVSKVEGENSGVQAGHLGERQIEKAVGYGGRRFHQARADRKLKPWRDVTKAEQAAAKVNADFYWQKSVMENPQLASSNPISRLWQKNGCKSSMPPHIGQGPARPRLRERHPRPPLPRRRRAAGPWLRSWAALSRRTSTPFSSWAGSG